MLVKMYQYHIQAGQTGDYLAMQGINKQAEIQGLFDRLQSLLCPENSQIPEESFVIRKEIFYKHK